MSIRSFHGRGYLCALAAKSRPPKARSKLNAFMIRLRLSQIPSATLPLHALATSLLFLFLIVIYRMVSPFIIVIDDSESYMLIFSFFESINVHLGIEFHVAQK